MTIFNVHRLTITVSCLFILSGWVIAEAGEVVVNPNILPVSVQSLSYLPVVISGKALSPLINVPVTRISALSLRKNIVAAISFQIDKRDRKGRYVISNKNSAQNMPLENNDECVFMAMDAGDRIENFKVRFAQQIAVEVRVTDPQTNQHRWVYLVETKADETAAVTEPGYVSYDADKDSVETPAYKIGFSRTLPFLMNSLQWHTDTPEKWTNNVVDTMKIRHVGKLLGQPFVRTQADYKSQLVGVKNGPVRVIRRTVNRVRVLAFLQSPSVAIDYIVFANGFQMDTTVDFPFPMGWFFSNVNTYTTVNLNDDPTLPVTQVFQNNLGKGLTIDGKMTKEKERFNQAGGQQYAMQNTYGLLMTQLILDKDLPVIANNYMQDDRSQAEAPENRPGQFGGIGFLSTNWEMVDTAPHHLWFNVLLLQKVTLEQGFKALESFPKHN